MISKMSFKRERTKDYFLLDTHVENMFINEYMISAPGDYVKVYLFALMYADLGVEFSNEDIAKQLSMDIEDVLKAWTYWEKMGTVRKIRTSAGNSLEYGVEFVLLKDMLYGSHGEENSLLLDQTVNAQMADQDCKVMFERIEKAIGRVISGAEAGEILSWINDFGSEPEVIAFAFEYCAGIKKKSVKYVEAVIRNWHNEGCRTIDEVREHVGQMEKMTGNHKRVFQALGFNRNPTEEERRIMNGWFDEMGFDIDKVLVACSKTAGISSPNINYVNRVLHNWYKEGAASSEIGAVTAGEISAYYELLRAKEEKEADERRNEVYEKVPRIREIDEEETELSAELSRIIISDRVDKKEAIEETREKIDTLNMEKAFLLTDNGFELNYVDVRYQCPKCRDTGILETGERCQCSEEITEGKIKQLMKTK